MNKMSTEKMTGTEAEGPTVESTTTVVREKRSLRTMLMLIVPAVILLAGVAYWLAGAGKVSTDNAQVKQDIVSVSAQVNGPVSAVLVKNGDEVKRGQVLFRIDPAPYRVALEQAEAQLAAARLQTTQLRTQAAGTGADITGAAANLQIKRNALSRQQALLKEGFTTRSDYEDALNEVRGAETQLADARARAANASAAIAPGEQPSIAQAQAAVERPGSIFPAPKFARRWTAMSPTPTGFKSDRWRCKDWACCPWSMTRAHGSKRTSRKRMSAR